MITVFLPCRKGSQRVPDKNTRPFAGEEGGLLVLKLKQLLSASRIDRVVLSTNDEKVMALAGTVEDSRLEVKVRPDVLSSSSTSTDDLIDYVPNLIESGVVLWTHVTSPFVVGADYDQMIAAYEQALTEGYDSLMTVTKVQKFLWNEQEPINYDRNKEKWPRTQTIAPIWEVNSAAFIAPIEVYKNLEDRIGNKPHFYELEESKGFDIDWELDFLMAEKMWEHGKV